VAVVVVGYNSGAWLGRCFSSLLAVDANSVLSIYVDNDSHDNSVAIASQFPTVQVVRSPRNVGFGAGCNLGAEAARNRGVDYLFFLNPDTRASTEAVLASVDFLHRNGSFGAVGPLQIEYGKSKVSYNRWVRRAVLCLATYPPDHHRVSPLSNQALLRSRILDRDTIEVCYVQGAAFAIPAELFHRIGGFDSRYFLFFEEVDLCRKMHWLGYTTALLPRLTVEHGWGGHGSGSRLRHWLRSKYMFILTDPALHAPTRLRLLRRHLRADIASASKNPDTMRATVSALAWLLLHTGRMRASRTENEKLYRGSYLDQKT
jgi:GT2 family glycosyltransferase